MKIIRKESDGTKFHLYKNIPQNRMISYAVENGVPVVILKVLKHVPVGTQLIYRGESYVRVL